MQQVDHLEASNITNKQSQLNMGIDMIVITILCTLHCHNTQKFNAENVQQSIHVLDKAYQQISTVQYSLYTVLS